MATILDLFKKSNKDIYGIVGKSIIESKGLINPPRGAALLASSPNAIADMVGNQIGGILKGSANRPSDTIFKNDTPFSKPISLLKTPSDLKNAVEKDTEYFVKQSPSGQSIIATAKQGASSPIGILANIGLGALKGEGLLGLKKKNPTAGNRFGDKWQSDINGKPLSGKKTFNSKGKSGKGVPYYEVYKEVENEQGTGRKEFVVSELKERAGYVSYDDAVSIINTKDKFKDNSEADSWKKQYKTTNQILVLFQKYGDVEVIPFAGTVSNISEDISPEWTDFRYVGSPFKVYRYLGVERDLSFDLKLYYTNEDEKKVMISKIAYLKSLAFPYEQISQIEYKNSKDGTQYAFAPNLIYVSVGDLYKRVLTYVDSISFNIDNNVTWPNFNYNMEYNKDSSLYPSVIDVQLKFKIIETHKINTNTKTTFKYSFNEGPTDINNTMDNSKPSEPAGDNH